MSSSALMFSVILFHRTLVPLVLLYDFFIHCLFHLCGTSLQMGNTV